MGQLLVSALRGTLNVMTKVQNPRHNSLKPALDAGCSMHCLTIVAQCTHSQAPQSNPHSSRSLHRVSVVSMF